MVSHLDPELAGPDFDSPINCGYAGMEKLPYSEVTLAEVDLQTGTMTEFTIYAGATSEADCTSADTSAKTLNQAKARFKQLGLDITKRPTAVATSGTPWKIAGQTFTVSTSVTQAPEDMVGTAMLEIARGDEVVYRSSRSFGLAMAGSGKSSIAGAYVTSAGVVFLERFDSFSGRGGAFVHYTLTPAISAVP
jgi:hypothetical protein